MFFFFSSRRRHTRFTSDWSSDVCSSDLSDSISEFSFELEVSHARINIDAVTVVKETLSRI